MGKLKRFGIGAGITTLVFCGLTGFWYRSHYTLPSAPEPQVILPSPNGFDTLQAALKLTVMEQGGVTLRPKIAPDSSPVRYITHSLAARQTLVKANAASIATTREALSQQYHIPPRGSAKLNGIALRDQARLLIFAGDASSDGGNQTEAARYYLDAIELGVAISHGGRVMPFLYGNACENMGTTALDRLAEKLDAKTARAAAERLAKIEKQRTPFSEILHQENRELRAEMELLFTDSPFTAWQNIGKTYGQTREVTAFISTFVAGQEPEPPSFADKAQLAVLQAIVTYQGPGPTITELDQWLNKVAAQSELPWGPQRPTLQEPATNVIARLIGPVFTQTEFHYLLARTRLALLQTKLRLRVSYLETGRYPTALENLPTDPFSPARSPLHYRSDGKTYTLWSVGPDARDDGGVSVPSSNKDKKRKPSINVRSAGDILA